ncbi:MAG: DUF4430 domain-containing protein [Clostridiales Family XIII bacterium]|jgi:hypothetical protein|nr:DUF4430 domain-containing protein [Clostridiales Family XIII bacterium]
MGKKKIIAISSAMAVLAIISVWCFAPGAVTAFGTGSANATLEIQDEATPLSDGIGIAIAEDHPSPNAATEGALVDPQSGSDLESDVIAMPDQYHTDPIPAGQPLPQEPQNVQINPQQTYICTLYIECGKILDPNNIGNLNPAKTGIVPGDGVILSSRTVSFTEGESVFDVLARETRNNGIHMEFVDTPIYNSAYIEGIANLYEFDCGELSGWVYSVNGWFPNYGSSRYQLQDGDTIEWHYSCDLGRDFGLNF